MSNTRKMNELEELGRVDAEKAYTKKGKRNLRAEKKRIVREVSSRGSVNIKDIVVSHPLLSTIFTEYESEHNESIIFVVIPLLHV